MENMTVLFLLLAVSLFVLIQFKKTIGLKFFSVFLSVISMMVTLTDGTLNDSDLLLFIIPAFFTFLMSVAALLDKGVKD